MRWDEDGKPRVPVDPKAKIEVPAWMPGPCRPGNGRLGVPQPPAGRYDLIILANDASAWRASAIHPSTSSTPSFPPMPRGPRRRQETDRQAILPSRSITRTRSRRCSWRGTRSRCGSRPARPRPADQLRHRFRCSGGDGPPRGLAIHQQLRWLGQGPRDRSSGPDPHGQERIRLWTWVWEPRLGGIEVGTKPLQSLLRVTREV